MREEQEREKVKRGMDIKGEKRRRGTDMEGEKRRRGMEKKGGNPKLDEETSGGDKLVALFPKSVYFMGCRFFSLDQVI